MFLAPENVRDAVALLDGPKSRFGHVGEMEAVNGRDKLLI